MKFKKYLLNEGTWAIPNTLKKVKELEKLFKRPLPKKDIRKLWNLVGNDMLMDTIEDVYRDSEEGSQNEDIRWIVADWIWKNWISPKAKNINWLVKWEPEAWEKLTEIAKRYKK